VLCGTQHLNPGFSACGGLQSVFSHDVHRARLKGTGEAQTITITKDANGYSLGKPYDDQHFTEGTRWVLSDGKGGLGKVYLGSAEYADGKKVPILRVEFCYENFVLYRDPLSEHVGRAESQGK
jgi:hypothetical protein